MVESGVMAGAITQNPVGIGYETVAAAVKALKGETLPPVIDTGFYYYDATNIDRSGNRRRSLRLIQPAGPGAYRPAHSPRSIRSHLLLAARR